MRTINFQNDIQPLSEFRANTAKYVKQIKETKRPLILTQHGKSTAVLLDVSAYQSLLEQIELLKEIQIGEKQIEEGQYFTHEEVKSRIQEKFSKK